MLTLTQYTHTTHNKVTKTTEPRYPYCWCYAIYLYHPPCPCILNDDEKSRAKKIKGKK